MHHSPADPGAPLLRDHHGDVHVPHDRRVAAGAEHRELQPIDHLPGVLLIGKLARSLRAFHREEPAQTLIEFAIVLPIFLLVVTGLMDTARAVWQAITLPYSAREG